MININLNVETDVLRFIFCTFTVVDPPVPKVIPRFSCSDKSVMVHVQFNKSVRFCFNFVQN